MGVNAVGGTPGSIIDESDSYPVTVPVSPSEMGDEAEHIIKYDTIEGAVGLINSGDRVYLSTAASTPQALVNAMSARHKELSDVKVISIHTEGPAPYATNPDMAPSFSLSSMFTGSNVRKVVQEGARSNYIPIHLSDIPRYLDTLTLDVAMVTVSPPDEHGYCSLGTSVDVTLRAIHKAKKVIAQVNRFMPRVHGSGVLHVSAVDSLVRCDHPLAEVKKGTGFSWQEEAIGKNVASLIEDEACLQLGIGSIPDAVLSQLGTHRDLGIHSEMISDGVIDLVDNGVVTNSKKNFHQGEIVTSFIFGTKRLYDFVHDNPLVKALPIEVTNDPFVIASNDKATAINSCIAMDLTGQANADSIGTKIYSGFGGQVDFMYGASRSRRGKPIFALQSKTAKGASKIVTTLPPGAGVVTSRAHVRWVVTEYGIADLFGKTLPERARRLIDIAHPDDREHLEREAFEILRLKI